MAGIVDPVKSFQSKQNDKFVVELRLGKLTVLEISYDVSEKKFVLNLLSLLIIDTSKKQ